VRASEVTADLMSLSLLTLGDPKQRTGGYRYHRMMAGAAPDHGAEIRFTSIPPAGWPTGVAGAVREASVGAHAILLDSLAAAPAAPWLGRASAPLVAVVHQRPGGVGHGRIRARFLAAVDRSAYRRAAGAIVASDDLVDDLRRAGVQDERIRVVHPGCDVPVAAGPRLDLRRGRDVAVLCVANWLPAKGILELLDAFATLPPEAATLWLVGSQDADRAYSERVRRRISSPDLSPRVAAAGPLPIEQVGRYLRSADVFAMCSTVDAYGTAWAEAIRAGLPVVGWRAANLPRLAEDGREALMAPPGDGRRLAAALGSVVTDAGVREHLAAGARHRAQTLPTWERSAERFFVAVRELLRPRTTILREADDAGTKA
jgi:glycosyltransferase involved in cell wall biosynthesis